MLWLPPEKRGEEAELRRKERGRVLFNTAGLEAAVVLVMVVAGVKGVCGSRGWKASTGTSSSSSAASSIDGARPA